MRLPDDCGRAELLEVVRLSDAARPFTAHGLTGEVVDVWVEDEAAQALALVGALPDSPRYRCFVPGWGLRLHESASHEPLLEIAFCFRCNGARVQGRNVPEDMRFQDFESESPPGRELLRRFRACAPG